VTAVWAELTPAFEAETAAAVGTLRHLRHTSGLFVDVQQNPIGAASVTAAPLLYGWVVSLAQQSKLVADLDIAGVTLDFLRDPLRLDVLLRG
jgi:hypothetical protein